MFEEVFITSDDEDCESSMEAILYKVLRHCNVLLLRVGKYWKKHNAYWFLCFCVSEAGGDDIL
jgi:hypothetical protein